MSESAELCLNIGAWEHRIPGYLGVDANATPAADVVQRVPPLRWPDGAVAHIYAGHFLEHLAPWDVEYFLRECARVLRPGGTLTLITPDMRRVRLLADSQVLAGPATARLLVGETGDMAHWTLWTAERIKGALRRVGLAVDEGYDWRADARLYDREASWQGGARGIKQ